MLALGPLRTRAGPCQIVARPGLRLGARPIVTSLDPGRGCVVMTAPGAAERTG